MQTWVYILEKAGSVKPADIQRAANTIHIPGEQLIVPWDGIKFSTSDDEIGQNTLGHRAISEGPGGESGTRDHLSL